MVRVIAAVLIALVSVVAAPHAAADPEDLVPYCSGDQTPMDNNCRPMAHQEFTHGSGLDPNLPSGLTPGSVAAIND
ncbi:hypothetical protein SAMN04489835_2473 [Mycolicibacterium rutilum]|uniref:Uncharacterized protein n=1 Tax=Mycolicibacterium rutilum TaxID=370526 RepID=A0A1H6JWW2_MYCRU|nr:hypothetical protein [Mycolicibacterium rutilum]SEH65126.1 hypothetical protein SAMN04489835_2473 [Mycolicibacterium rutilum]